MSGVLRRLRAGYGAGPLHLLSVVACLAFTAFLVPRVAAPGVTLDLLLWFGGALVLHDLVLFPLYTLADRGATTLSRATPAPVPWLNHVRVPALLSGLLLLLWFPLVLRVTAERYESLTGLSVEPFRGRWLAVTAVLFAGSGLLYAVRVGRAVRAGQAAGSGAEQPARPGAEP